MLSGPCREYLTVWHFSRAFSYLSPEATPLETNSIRALAEAFGNSGRFYGVMGAVAGSLVSCLLSNETPSQLNSGNKPFGDYGFRSDPMGGFSGGRVR